MTSSPNPNQFQRHQFTAGEEQIVAERLRKRRRRMRWLFLFLGFVGAIVTAALVVVYIALPGNMSLRSDWDQYAKAERAKILPPETRADIESRFDVLAMNRLVLELREERTRPSSISSELLEQIESLAEELDGSLLFVKSDMTGSTLDYHFYLFVRSVRSYYLAAGFADYIAGDHDGLIMWLDHTITISKSVSTESDVLYPEMDGILMYMENAVYLLNDPEIDAQILERLYRLSNELVILPPNFSSASRIRPLLAPKYVPVDLPYESALLEYLTRQLDQRYRGVDSSTPMLMHRGIPWNFPKRRILREKIKEAGGIEAVTFLPKDFLDRYPRSQHLYAVALQEKITHEHIPVRTMSRIALLEMSILARQFKREHDRWPLPGEDFRTDQSRPWLYEKVVALNGSEPFVAKAVTMNEDAFYRMLQIHWQPTRETTQYIRERLEDGRVTFGYTQDGLSPPNVFGLPMERLWLEKILASDLEIESIEIVYQLFGSQEWHRFSILQPDGNLVPEDSKEWAYFSQLSGVAVTGEHAKPEIVFTGYQSVYSRKTVIKGIAPAEVFTVYSPTALREFDNKESPDSKRVPDFLSRNNRHHRASAFVHVP